MEKFSSTTVSYSPSFSVYASSECAAAAVKVSRENQNYNITDQYSVKVEEDDDFQFETSRSPVHEETFFHFPTFRPHVSSDTVSMSKKKDDDDLFRYKFSENCLWSPLRPPATGGGHSKVSKRCRLTKFLTRSHSDATKTCLPDMKRKDKSASDISEGDKRRKSYLPYRQDLIGVFAEMRRLRH
ncbi:hypothetical protein BRARA_E03662 [Brassica rapa]|uniref:Uncharacterized protein n=1 Tax=Brassica campestris TaxID=3711 RepID=A0A397ZK64_BRACM|nr:hypothetical protein BRARA_E03662 [Brassica rapa]